MKIEGRAATPEDFLTRYPDIRAGLNRTRFVSEGWPVESRHIAHRYELAALHTCFRSSLGRINPHFLHWLAVRNLRVGEAARRLPRMPADALRAVEDYRKEFEAQDLPELTLPAYRVNESSCLLLDGNHRAVALLLADRPFSLTLNIIAGPRDDDAMAGISQCCDNT